MMDLNDDSPINIVGKTVGSYYFDEVIGYIEDIVLSEEFMNLNNNFLEAHYQQFLDIEENRLEYMDIYLKYVTTFEHYLNEELHKRMSNFDMQRFAEELSNETNLTNEANYDEIFELLQSFNSFPAFKELMLDYRRSKERKTKNLDFESILVTKCLMNNEKPLNSL